MRTARRLTVAAILSSALVALTPAGAGADGLFRVEANGNTTVDVDWSAGCANPVFPPRGLVARFFGTFNGGNAVVNELRIFNNTDRAVRLIGSVDIRGNATVHREYFGDIPPYGSVVKYPNVTLDSPNVTTYLYPLVGFSHPDGACNETVLQVLP